MSESGELWYVIETPQDFCVVGDDALETDFSNHFEVGDRVFFRWSKKTRLEGHIRFMNTDVTVCESEAHKLNKAAKAKRFKSSSFNEDGPRTAAKRALQNIQKKPASNSDTTKVRGDLASKRSRLDDAEILKNHHYGSSLSDSESTSRSDDDDLNLSKGSDTSLASMIASESDEDTPIVLPKKMPTNDSQPKKTDLSNTPGSKKNDKLEILKMVLQIVKLFTETPSRKSMRPVSVIGKEKPQDTSSPLRSSLLTSHKETINRNLVTTPSSKSTSSVVQTPAEANGKVSKLSTAKGVTPHKVHGEMNKFKGTMYLFPSLMEDAVSVFDTEINCCLTWWARAENANTATAVARRLYEGVFTREALLSCSVSGLPPRGRGKAAYESDYSLVKPFLCPKAVNAIVCQAMTWQKQKHFVKRNDAAQITQAMRVKMNDLQRIERKQQEKQ
ncbi:Putative BEN domain-containing protein B1 [Frankliniella fusca]|uniref:BEN domain-containing protein B1 n=1 Tax=Frankliniella fusca TaxID=407009 RepID=A0AAE1HNP0_9NEOP|nr:Putative BEN domain-containing protein B1 [Frankliniella fusca]